MRTVGVEVDGARCLRAAGGGCDSHRQVEAIDERYCILSVDQTITRATERRTIVPVSVASGGERPLGDGGGRNTSASAGVTLKAAVAATGDAGRRARVGGKVAVGATPDTSGGPVVGDRDGLGRAGGLFPASNVVGDGGARVEVSEQL